MKKFTVCGAAVALCCLAGNVQAQEPEYPASASTEVFDFNSGIINVSAII